ncbi:unnamed protein product [Litomosoides sigmodontis]|uniref:F-box domain-containing protein n=1 Tax=Litomosoides sigmodontis TaxID=42156 RepID=A0A3P6TVT0_LITSI|nr:unnamed protein product [Litomosoides sigmodontis]
MSCGEQSNATAAIRRKRNRRRKQFDHIKTPLKDDRNSKIHFSSKIRGGVIKMGCDTASSMLQRLPIVVLSQIVSHLNLSDQKNFGDTCKAARMALNIFWDTYTDLHIDTLMRKTFSFISETKRCSLHTIRREIGLALSLIPDFTLRKLHLHPIYALHLRDLQEIEILTEKSPRQIFGALRHLDLRGCAVEYGELHYFSNACVNLSSIALTHAAVFLPFEIFVNEDLIKEYKMKHPFKIFQNFLRASLPNFVEMEKEKEIPTEHIELIFKLLMLFPRLETFHFD